MSRHVQQCVITQPFSEDQEAVAKGTRCDSKLDCALDSFCTEMTESGVPWVGGGGVGGGVMFSAFIKDLKIPNLCYKAKRFMIKMDFSQQTLTGETL